VFDLTRSVFPVPPDLARLLDHVWDDMAAPGSWWTGAQRVAIASVARGDQIARGELPPGAVHAARTIGMSPAAVTSTMVLTAVEEVGEGRYVELVGVVACLAAVDTITRMLGCGIAPLPTPQPGDRGPEVRVRGLNRDHTWVSIAGPPVPRNALSAVPRTQATMVRLLESLYMPPGPETGDRMVRGLTPEQMELVIIAVSHGNECFY
jgi:hypothetical protein